MTQPVPLNPQVLVELARTRMPFGRYKGRVLCDLPEPYLVWLNQKGFPPGSWAFCWRPCMR